MAASGAAPWGFDVLTQGGMSELRVIVSGVVLSAPIPSVQVTELDQQNCGLNFVQTEVSPDSLVVILRLAAVRAQYLHALSECRIVSGAHSAIAKCAEILAWKEGKAAYIADASGTATVGRLCADRLRCVLDYAQPICLGQLHESVHVGHLAEQMDWHQCFDDSARSLV